MTIPYCVQIGDTVEKEQITEIETLIFTSFSEIHRLYNNWNPHSEISQLNRLAAFQKITLSPELANFLSRVDHIVSKTEGRFDPTVEPLQQIWKKSLNEGTQPSDELLKEVFQAIGWDKIHIEEGVFWKEHALTAIDLGGIAKGYGVDLLVQKLSDAGFSNIYVEWGGEIRTTGKHPDQRPWKIGIKGLFTLDLSNTAIATSGSYVQNWTINNVRYTHIIDPYTLKPLQNSPISSVSIVAPTCLEADGLATALMLFSSLEAAEEWAKNKQIQAYIW